MRTLAKVFAVLAVLLFAFIATLAFAIVGLRPDSEVTTHLFSDEQFVRARPICAVIGIVASILALSLVGWLWRAARRSHEMA